MNSIIIVDDEIGVRNSIKAKINWHEAGFYIAGEAQNGQEAIRLLETGPLPDVLMTDIRMPHIDGIELIKNCKQLYPELKIVVLSGYSDYEYMQVAIHAGVKDYLLKPIRRRELVELLHKLSVELQSERSIEARQRVEQAQREQHLQASREALLLRLAKDESTGMLTVKERIEALGLTQLLELGERRKVRFMTVEMRVPKGRLDGNDHHIDLLRLAFGMLCRELAGEHEGILPFYDASHPAMIHFVIIETSDSARPAIDKQNAKQFAAEIRYNIVQYLKLDCVIGLGEPVSDVLQFKNAFSSCMLSWSRSTVDGIACDTAGSLPNMMNVFTPELERQLTVAIESGDQAAFSTYMLRIFPRNADYAMFSFTFMASRLLLLLHAIAKKYEDGTSDGTLQKLLWDCQMTIGDFQSREAVAAHLEELGQLVMDAAQKARGATHGSIAAAVQKYVDDNYTYELTLTGLAEMFYLNETYLSGLFKQHAGATFSDYVTRLRMNKAGELLRDSDLKLTDIAMLVGISSSSYFSTSFKKFYGMSPKEYREQHKSIG